MLHLLGSKKTEGTEDYLLIFNCSINTLTHAVIVNDGKPKHPPVKSTSNENLHV